MISQKLQGVNKAMSYRLVFSLIALSSSLLAIPSLAVETSKTSLTTTSESFTGKVLGNKVRVRTGADLDSHIVYELFKEDLILVKNEKNGFYAIEPTEEIKGYIFRAYVLDNIVEASHVNIRLEPSTEAPIIGQLNLGDKVQGIISKHCTKWLEIDLPSTTVFYIAKEYVEKEGDASYYFTYLDRKKEANNKLKEAIELADSEMQRPFNEIRIELIKEKLDHIITHYKDFKDHFNQALEKSYAVQDLYIQQKVQHLEEQNLAFSKNLSQKNSVTLASDTLSLNEDETFQEDCLLPKKSASLLSNAWEGIENSLFHLWLKDHPGKTQNDFYNEQIPFAHTLKGVIEPYNLAVKNRPGDYVVKVGGLPIAFIYSTTINLHDKVGKIVTLQGLKRSNNHFAYPAYFVISMQ